MMVSQLGCRHALAVTSGTGALICGLVGLGIGPGDEVIVPPTWLASAGAVPERRRHSRPCGGR